MSVEEGKVSPLRWRMISLAFFATMINYLDRQTLSVAAPVLREQFHMSNVEYSRVVFAFMLAYTIMNGLSGPMIDRLGTRLGYALVYRLVVDGGGPACVRAREPEPGCVTASCWAWARRAIGRVAVKVVAEWFPEQERALASGLFNSGSSVGAILAPPIVALDPAAIRMAGGVLRGRPGRLRLAAVLVAASITRRRRVLQEATRSPIPAWQLLRTRFVLGLHVREDLHGSGVVLLHFLVPGIFEARARDFDMAAIGKYAWIPFVVAGLGNLFGGMAIGRAVAARMFA